MLTVAFHIPRLVRNIYQSDGNLVFVVRNECNFICFSLQLPSCVLYSLRQGIRFYVIKKLRDKYKNCLSLKIDVDVRYAKL